MAEQPVERVVERVVGLDWSPYLGVSAGVSVVVMVVVVADVATVAVVLVMVAAVAAVDIG